jgi:DNA-binding NarL/FixJ family response regulator
MIVGQAQALYEAVSIVLDRRPDVVLLDVSATDSLFLEAIRRMKEGCTEAKILVLSISGELTSIARCLKAGASACLPADVRIDDLFQLVRGSNRPLWRPQSRPLVPQCERAKRVVRKSSSRIIPFPGTRRT